LPVNGDAHWNTMKEHDQRGNWSATQTL
jgi:hypothetical protein